MSKLVTLPGASGALLRLVLDQVGYSHWSPIPLSIITLYQLLILCLCNNLILNAMKYFHSSYFHPLFP